MRHLLLTLCLLLISGSHFVHGDIDQTCQDGGVCAPCPDDDRFCTSINGKRIDSGGSLGKQSSPPANTEKELDGETFELHLKDKMQKQGFKEHEKTVIRTDVKFVIDSLFAPKFDYGKASLTQSLKDDLARLAGKLLEKENIRLVVEGHTDSHRLSAKTAGIFGDNRGLGQARADSAAKFLSFLLELAPDQVEAISHGATKPIRSNNTAKGRAENRRVEIFVSYDKKVTVQETVTEKIQLLLKRPP